MYTGDRQLGRAVRGRARLCAGGAELRAVQTTNGKRERYTSVHVYYNVLYYTILALHCIQ